MIGARRAGILVVGAIAWSLGCGGPAEIAPPEIRYGEDLCARCGMIVSEERFAAAALIRDDGGLTPRLYDDIGCMIADSAGPVAGRWVHDLESLDWVEADRAAYVQPSGLVTPMLSGLAAFALPEAAAAAGGGGPAAVRDLRALLETAP